MDTDFEEFLRHALEIQATSKGRDSLYAFVMGIIDGILCDEALDSSKKVDRVKTAVDACREFFIDNSYPWSV